MGQQRTWKALAMLVAVASLTETLAAQQPVSHETVTLSQLAASSLASTTTSPAGIGQVSSCVFSVESGPIRVWVDGTDPTASTGFYFAVGAHVVMTSYQVAKQFRAIAVNSTATLQASCTKGGGVLPSTSPFIVSYETGPVGVCNALSRAAGICR